MKNEKLNMPNTQREILNMPTELAFETLGFGQEAEDISNISILHVLGDIRDFKVGDNIKIASRKLIIRRQSGRAKRPE